MLRNRVTEPSKEICEELLGQVIDLKNIIDSLVKDPVTEEKIKKKWEVVVLKSRDVTKTIGNLLKECNYSHLPTKLGMMTDGSMPILGVVKYYCDQLSTDANTLLNSVAEERHESERFDTHTLKTLMQYYTYLIMYIEKVSTYIEKNTGIVRLTLRQLEQQERNQTIKAKMCSRCGGFIQR